MSGRIQWLGNKPQLRLPADPAGDAHVLTLGALEVIEVLLECRLVELRQELGLDRRVILPDLVDELTFTHRVFSFAKVRSRTGLRPVNPHTTARVPKVEIGRMSART